MLTPNQIRRQGLEALREWLGQAGMIRFMAQFDNGCGDYAKDRHEWVDQTSAEIRNAAHRKKQPKKP